MDARQRRDVQKDSTATGKYHPINVMLPVRPSNREKCGGSSLEKHTATSLQSSKTTFVRDFSHGCIRVEKPEDLVACVLQNNPGWDLDRVKTTMNGEKNNAQVTLAATIPVLIVYGTATVNEENQIRFFDDIYGYDKELDKALSARYP
jgi:hypothetical protein